MRHAMIISLTALATATLTILSMNAVYAPANNNSVAHTTASMDILQMTKNARNLPDERFDAY
jgi:hypothetical protein